MINNTELKANESNFGTFFLRGILQFTLIKYGLGFILLLYSFACKQKVIRSEITEYAKLIEDSSFINISIEPEVYLEDGIYIERKSLDVVNFNYSTDNTIFVDGSNFKYTYVYIKEQDSLFIKVKHVPNQQIPSWDLSTSKDDSTITIVSITPEVYSNFFGDDYKQTIVRYDYFNQEGELLLGGAKSGCIENFRNLWLHPPRDLLFKILQLNPFPFVQAPYTVDNQWYGQLTIGNFWADNRWEVWEDPITSTMSYKITSIETIQSEIGPIECLVISAKAESELGETSLTNWYNSTHGFVRMEYYNIDNSVLHFQRTWN